MFRFSKRLHSIFFIFFVSLSALAAPPIISFQNGVKNPTAIFDTPNNYDYEQNAFYENGNLRTWYCGGYTGTNGVGDAIYYSMMQPNGTLNPPPSPVMTARGSLNYAAEDSKHACSPSVIKRSDALILGGQELHYMYYECARHFFAPNSTIDKEGFAQICLAISTDGVTWTRYNETQWTTYGNFGNASTEATPIISVPQQILTNTNYQFEAGTQHHTLNYSGNYDYELNYGVGRPAALLVNTPQGQQVWLYYWSGSAEGLYLAKSWDGLHFFGHQKLGRLGAVGKVAYYPGSFAGHTGVYFALISPATTAFTYSFDGTNWYWPEAVPPDSWWPVTIGKVNSGMCIQSATIVTDKVGHLSSVTNVKFLSAEGYMGHNDPNGDGAVLGCYHADEEDERGKTWGIYSLSGSFYEVKPIGKTSDFSGDRVADISVFRPSNGTWYVSGVPFAFGESGDVPVSGDFRGDGTADYAFFRPSTGTWYIAGLGNYMWGAATDKPVPADYDGDGRTDIAVYRPSTGEWFVIYSLSQFTTTNTYEWGINGDIPVPADYTGDGKADLAIFRPSTSTWIINGLGTYVYGISGDIPVPSDFNGDGTTELAVFRPSNSTWYINSVPVPWGTSGDVPLLADFDGDNKTDITVYRPSTSQWFILKSSSQWTTSIQTTYGNVGDIPIGKVQN